MSNEENTEQTENTEQIESAVDSTVEAETVDSVKAEPAVDQAGNAISLILGLKEKNPKVFFGGIGAIVVLLILIVSGGDDPKLVSGPKIKDLAVGQKYVLKSANSYDPSATVQVVGLPDIKAFDSTKETGEIDSTPCLHLPQGTSVSVLELQEVPGAKLKLAKVKVEDEGECKGKDGWALSIDVQ